jgi:hypothetical protein
MDDDVELRRLRERVYGAEGATATPAMRERLAELEDRVRPLARNADLSAPADASRIEASGVATAASAPEDVTPEHETENPDAAPPSSSRALRRTLIAVGAVALLGAGVAVGAAVTASAAPAPTPIPVTADSAVDPAAARYPELTFQQTIEDAISAEVLRDSAIDSGSTRYIATVSDYEIFFAQPDDGDGRCIITFTATDNRPWSAACASGAQEGAAVFRIDEGLTVAIGTPDASQIGGIPIRLSESVTAFVAR